MCVFSPPQEMTQKKHINKILAPTQSRDNPANLFMFMSESSKPVQIRTYLHERPQKTKTNMYKFARPRPRLVSSNQEQTYTNSHHLVEDSVTPAEGLLAAGGANSGFGAC